SVIDPRPKIAAPTISFGTPKMTRPSNFVSSTTTRSGTRKIRVMVSALGRFIAFEHMITSVVADEGDPARRGQGHAAAAAHDPHPEADRPDLRSPLPALSARSPQAGPRDRRSDPEPELSAAAHRGDFRRRWRIGPRHPLRRRAGAARDRRRGALRWRVAA